MADLETLKEFYKFRDYVRDGGKIWNTSRNKWLGTSYFKKWLYMNDFLNNPFMYHQPFNKQLDILLDTKYIHHLCFNGLGSSKTEMLTMRALVNLNIPNSSTLICRNSYSALKLPGNLLSRIYDYCVRSGQSKKINFNKLDNSITNKENGAVISSWCARTSNIAESTKDDIASSEFNSILFDELYSCPEEMLFAFTRLRIPKSKDLQKYCMIGSNPPYRTKTSKWLVDWLNTNNPHPNKLDCFFEIDKDTAHYPINFRDNPFIPPQDIIDSTKNLSQNDKERLLEGSMVSLPSKGILIDYNQLEERLINYKHSNKFFTFIGIDLAGEGKDFTALTVLNLDEDSNIYLSDNYLIDTLDLDEDYEDSQLTSKIEEIQNKYNKIEAIIVEKSTGGAGSRVINYIRTLFQPIVGQNVPILEQPLHNKGKFERSKELLYSIKDNDDNIRTYLNSKAEYISDFMYECITITPIKKDIVKSPDLLDSTSLIYNWLKENFYLNFEFEVYSF